MSDRPEASGKGLEAGSAGTKQGMSIKDWWTTILSTLGFLIAATSFYWAMQQTEDVRAVVEGLPEIRFEKDRLTTDGKSRIAIINAGDQSVTIFKTFISVWQVEQPMLIGAPACEKRMVNRDEAETNLEPFVVKPGETIVKDVALRKLQSVQFRPHMTWQFPASPFKEYLVQTCIEFTFATPSKSAGFKAIEIGRRFIREDTSMSARGEGGRSKPYTLRFESSNVIKSWWRGDD